MVGKTSDQPLLCQPLRSLPHIDICLELVRIHKETDGILRQCLAEFSQVVGYLRSVPRHFK